MGQKTHPLGFRLGITKDWKSFWFDESHYTQNLLEDLKIRAYIQTKLRNAMVSGVEVRRVANRTLVAIYTARPGMVFGSKRSALEALGAELRRLLGREVQLAVEVVRAPELEPALVAYNIARQIEERVAYRRAMRRAISQAMRQGAVGIKVALAGRLGGREIAQSVWYREGRVPLQTLKADIEYACDTAYTIYGTVGVKVWINRGEVS
jgi:small subunit ribosomal protein S3